MALKIQKLWYLTEITILVNVVKANIRTANWKYIISKQYWKHHILWSDGYFACSIGEVSQEIRLLKNISKIKGNGNERCVSTHLKVCGFAAVNI